MALSRPSIEPFRGENFLTWKFRVQSLLAECDVLECVEREATVKSVKKGEEKALKKDAKAKNIIVQCVADSHVSILQGKATAYDMWKSLSDSYEKKGLCGKMILKKKLLSMKMSDSETVQEYTQRFETVISELKTVDDSVMKTDELICNYMMGLHEKFNTIVSLIESQDPDELTFEYVKRRMKNEEEKTEG
uniref:Copia protein n=1 Tax=Cacopsylla melanoneura TaxID=428564 RepID=A0A8D8WYB7_9HEMI